MLRIVAAVVVIATIFALSPVRDGRDGADAAAAPELLRLEAPEPAAALEAWRTLPESAREALGDQLLRNFGARAEESSRID